MVETGVGAPQTGPADELIEAGFALEVADAPYLHRGLNLADMAHVLVLREAGIVPSEPAARLLELLLQVHREVPADRFPYDPQFGDAYNSRERFFIERLGTDAGWLHAGRPRREAGRVALRICLRDLATALTLDTAGFAETVAERSEQHADVVMPDQTYLQQAQPSTFGHYLLTFAHPALRDAERLLQEDDWVNRSPGGAGCVNGSRLRLDRERTAELLGFGTVIEHTRDAMWQTDGLVALLADAAGLVSNLSKLAEDLEIWDSQEFDFVQLSGPYTRSSILMPQKKNPYALAIVRGAGGVLIGRLSGFLAVVKTPSARSDNLIFAYGEVPRALELAGRVTRLLRGVIDTLEVHPDKMWASLEAGFSQATDLAEYVMETCGVDYRTAYLIVGDAVQRAAREGLRGIDLTGGMLDGAAEERIGRSLDLAGRDLSEVLDPKAIVMTRTSPGGAASSVIRDMSAAVRARSNELAAEAERRRKAYRASEAALVRKAEEVASG